ncbi:MAG: polysaccharide biosynthesis C-terminal domain-containing protein [Oscillospiraceae bacterium]|nr:polysaccharide biosynthesis C-terminal domain-containing protein [Oscillospiraceae bacterium]
MVSTMVITRLLTPNEYGIWSYALNIYSYLLLATGFGLISGALQFGTENRGSGDAFAFFRYCTQKGLLINVALVAAVSIVIAAMELPITGAKPYVLTILPILLLEFIVSMGQTVLRAQNRIKEYAHVLNINTILIALGTCGGAFWGLNGVLAGRYLANVASILYEGSLLVSEINNARHSGELKVSEKKQLWHYSLFTGASSAMNCLVYSLDVTLIAVLIKSATEISIYQVGTLIPNALQFIPSSVVTAILPSIIYHREDADWIKINLKKIYLALAGANGLICGILYVLAPLGIWIVSGEQYLPAVPVLRVLAFGYFFSGTFRTLSVNILAAFRRVHFGLFISIVSCVSDVVFNYIFIGRFGMIGAAYATLLVDMITAALSFGYVTVLVRKGKIHETH